MYGGKDDACVWFSDWPKVPIISSVLVWKLPNCWHTMHNINLLLLFWSHHSLYWNSKWKAVASSFSELVLTCTLQQWDPISLVEALVLTGIFKTVKIWSDFFRRGYSTTTITSSFIQKLKKQEKRIWALNIILLNKSHQTIWLVCQWHNGIINANQFSYNLFPETI